MVGCEHGQKKANLRATLKMFFTESVTGWHLKLGRWRRFCQLGSLWCHLPIWGDSGAGGVGGAWKVKMLSPVWTGHLGTRLISGACEPSAWHTSFAIVYRNLAKGRRSRLDKFGTGDISRATLSKKVAVSHMWPFKFKLLKYEIQRISCTVHILSLK